MSAGVLAVLAIALAITTTEVLLKHGRTSDVDFAGESVGGGVEQIVPIESSPTPSGQVPKLGWPVDFANHESVFIQLHPDTDPATGTWRDFQCNAPFTYDGHRGTDFHGLQFPG